MDLSGHVGIKFCTVFICILLISANVSCQEDKDDTHNPSEDTHKPFKSEEFKNEDMGIEIKTQDVSDSVDFQQYSHLLDKHTFKEDIQFKPHFVVFVKMNPDSDQYVDCPNCKAVHAQWSLLAEKFNPEMDDGPVYFAAVDCIADKELCDEEKVTKFPSMRFYGMIDISKYVEYTGGITEAELESFTKEQLKTAEPRPKPKIVNEEVENDEGEDDQVKKAPFEISGKELEEHLSNDHHFVQFCTSTPECKNTAGLFKELHDLFQSVPDVHIVKIDCLQDEDICKKYEVQTYPTLIWFTHGVKGQIFSGEHSIPNYETFISKNIDEQDPSNSLDQPEGEDAERISGSNDDTTSETLVEPDPSLNKTPYEVNTEQFDKHIKFNHHFVKFYAPWCPHCQDIAPTWIKLHNKFAHTSQVNIIKVDCTKTEDLCNRYNIPGYPTLVWFRDGEKVDEFGGNMELGEFEKYANSMLKMKKGKIEEPIPDVGRIPEPGEMEAGGVLKLTADTFVNSISKGVTFIKFFAPWCGHCQALVQPYEALAIKLAQQNNIHIAEVDCTKEGKLCQDYNIASYPTLILYKNGEKIADYDKARNVENMFNFVMNHATLKDEL